MKKEKGKIKLGGFELFCLIVFAWPLLFIPTLLSSLSSIGTKPITPIMMFFTPLLTSVVLLIYNLYRPMTWIHMKIQSKWKLCGILSLISVILSVMNPLMSLLTGNGSLLYLLMKFIFGFVGVFLMFTGANTLALFLQGKANFTTTTKK